MKKVLVLCACIALFASCSIKNENTTLRPMNDSAAGYDYFGKIHNIVTEAYLNLPVCKSGEYLFETDEDFAKFMMTSAVNAASEMGIDIGEITEQSICDFLGVFNDVLSFNGDNETLVCHYINQVGSQDLRIAMLGLFEANVQAGIVGKEDFNKLYDTFLNSHPSVSPEEYRQLSVFKSVGNASHQLWVSRCTKDSDGADAYSQWVDAAVGVITSALSQVVSIPASAAASAIAKGVDMDKAIKDRAESGTD